jgi:PilZ domain-containing protein
MNWFASLRRVVTGSKEPEERRVHPRYKMQFRVMIRARSGTQSSACGDLSQSGIGVFTDAEMEIGERVMLTYELGDGSPPKHVGAVVRNRNGRRYGLEFVED